MIETGHSKMITRAKKESMCKRRLVLLRGATIDLEDLLIGGESIETFTTRVTDKIKEIAERHNLSPRQLTNRIQIYYGYEFGESNSYNLELFRLETDEEREEERKKKEEERELSVKT